MDTAFAILVGIGLAASCGFRVFVPMLVVSAAAHSGYLELSDSFRWLGTLPAIISFGVASLVEIAAYYVPWLDNALDIVATPIATIAGAVLFAASVTDLNPLLRWSLAIIAGGGSAAVVQGATVVSRLASTTTTGGLANFIFTTMETVTGFILSILSIIVPILAISLLVASVAAMFLIGRPILRRLTTPQNTRPPLQ
jgi:hypothetical protein